VRAFLGLGLTECAPDHSTISRMRRLIHLDTHRAVFTWVLQCLGIAGPVNGKTLAVDATTLEANAALSSIVRRDTGEAYNEFLTQLAQESGIETPTRADLAKLDRKRKNKGSNEDWEHPPDPDARIAKMKDGREVKLPLTQEVGGGRFGVLKKQSSDRSGCRCLRPNVGPMEAPPGHLHISDRSACHRPGGSGESISRRACASTFRCHREVAAGGHSPAGWCRPPPSISRNDCPLIVARLTAMARKLVIHQLRSTTWRVVAQGIEVADLEVNLPNWKRVKRRFVCLRQEISGRPEARRRRLIGFPGDT
jgi:hypothetical protein